LRKLSLSLTSEESLEKEEEDGDDSDREDKEELSLGEASWL